MSAGLRRLAPSVVPLGVHWPRRVSWQPRRQRLNPRRWPTPAQASALRSQSASSWCSRVSSLSPHAAGAPLAEPAPAPDACTCVALAITVLVTRPLRTDPIAVRVAVTCLLESACSMGTGHPRSAVGSIEFLARSAQSRLLSLRETQSAWATSVSCSPSPPAPIWSKMCGVRHTSGHWLHFIDR